MTTHLLVLAWLAPARAEDPGALLYLARSAATPGAPAEVALAWPEGSVTDVVLEAGDGARLGAVSRSSTGARALAWTEGSARQGSVRARVRGKDGAWHDTGRVGIASMRAIEPIAVADLPAGAAEGRIRFPGGAGIPDRARVVRVSEGSISEAVGVDDALEVRVKLSPDRTARVVAVTLLDTRTPGAMPRIALLRVHARTELSFPAEPGTTAVVRVGKRTLGPFDAGENGRIVAPVDVVPADTTWELQATDAAGNVQRMTGPLPARTSPVLLAVDPANPTEDAAWLYGWTAGGAPLVTAPVCVGDGGVRPSPIRVEDGVWRVRYPSSGTGAVECSSATSSVIMRASRPEPIPAQIALAVRPAQVSVDFPHAQVEASVLDTRGVRMPPVGLLLLGDGASLGPATESVDSLSAEIDARAAAREGRFALGATWIAPPSRDVPARLEVEAWRHLGVTRVRVGARDARGFPVEGAPVRIDAHEQTRDARTDARGDAWFDLSSTSATLVRATTGAIEAWASPLASDLPAPVRGPDLSERRDVPIVAGRALAVELPSPSGTVRAGDRVQLRVRVRDASGNALTDMVPHLSASAGRVDAPTLQGDAWVAAWSDDGDGVLGEVRVRASVGNDAPGVPSAEARWAVQPPPVRGSVALLAGAALNAGALTPMVGGVVHTRMPWLPDLLTVRLGVAGQAFEGAARGATEATSATVSALLLPVDLGVAAGRRDGRRSLDAHVALVLAPYRVRVRYGEQVTLTGLGLSDAGVTVGGSAGWRTGRTELYGEVRYSIYGASSPLLTFERPLGGPSLSLGYRFPW